MSDISSEGRQRSVIDYLSLMNTNSITSICIHCNRHQIGKMDKRQCSKCKNVLQYYTSFMTWLLPVQNLVCPDESAVMSKVCYVSAALHIYTSIVISHPDRAPATTGLFIPQLTMSLSMSRTILNELEFYIFLSKV